MELDPRKLIAAGVLAGALAFGGAAIAGAQEAPDDSPTTTVAPDDSTAEPDDTRPGCDEDKAETETSATAA